MTAQAPSIATTDVTTPQRRALVAACAGNAVEWYDYAVYSASAATLAAVLTAGGSGGFVTVFAVFAAACLFRPLGSLVIGPRTDRFGRRTTFAAMIVLMAGATCAVGLLPPWSAIGVAAPVCLLALRGVQAFSAGGETGVSLAYVSEYSPAPRRGLNGGWYLSTIAVGLAAGIGATALLAAVLQPASFQTWGWRLPFLFALPLGTVGLYLRLRLDETPPFRAVPRHQPVRPTVVLRDHRPAVGRGFLLACAYSAVFNVWFVFLPSYLSAGGHSTVARSLSGALVGLLTVVVTAPVLGRLSDRVGRRPLLIGACGTLLVAIVPLYLWVAQGSTQALVVGNVVVGVAVAAVVLPSFLADQFPVRVRATAIGLAFGIGSAVVGGTTPLVATVLSAHAPSVAVPGYVALWLVGGLVAALRSPETVTR